MAKKNLSSLTVRAHPALYRSYIALESALQSGSDAELVDALNLYIALAIQQSFLVATAMMLRDSLSRYILQQEAKLRKQADSTTTPKEPRNEN